jgi:pimeloyl-ACP methyl ester carboxylesterase
VLVVVLLRQLLTAGIVDWSGAKLPSPEDPLSIGYRGDPGQAFGWAFETLHYPTALGDAEAWLVPAEGDSQIWAVWVHGIGGIRENGYRITKLLHDAGIPVLMITYRNDIGAPRGEDGLYSFGLSEWSDLEAAVQLVLDRGAGRVLIAAESMGAGITGQYLKHGGNTDRVAGLVLDAPALDFPAVVQSVGKRRRIPLSGYVAAAGLWLWRFVRRDLRGAQCIDTVAGFAGPIFLSHGRRDPLVPFSISERLLAVRPDITAWVTDADQHPKNFEADRAGYTRALGEWIRALKAQN